MRAVSMQSDVDMGRSSSVKGSMTWKAYPLRMSMTGASGARSVGATVCRYSSTQPSTYSGAKRTRVPSIRMPGPEMRLRMAGTGISTPTSSRTRSASRCMRSNCVRSSPPEI